MDTEAPGLVPLLLLAGAGALVYSFLTFDRLVRAQYELHREAWRADGQPRGFFWEAPEGNWFAGSVALHRLSLTWMFSTPAWIAGSPSHRALLKRLRASAAVSSILLVGGVAVFSCE